MQQQQPVSLLKVAVDENFPNLRQQYEVTYWQYVVAVDDRKIAARGVPILFSSSQPMEDIEEDISPPPYVTLTRRRPLKRRYRELTEEIFIEPCLAFGTHARNRSY